MEKTSKVVKSVNAGELSPLLDGRIDQEKYAMGCRTMENFFPLIYGGAERRPGTQFIESQKTQSAKAKVVGFDHSVDDTYVLCFENNVIRVLKDDALITSGTGIEVDDSYSAAGTVISHWKMNDNDSNTVVSSITGGIDRDTKLCSNFDGTNEDVEYTDSLAGAATFGGNAELSSTQKKFGATSLLLDGTGDYITYPDSDDWNFAGGDWTIDARVMFNNLTGNQCIVGQYIDDDNRWLVFKTDTGKMAILFVSGSIIGYYLTNDNVIVDADTWYHVTFERYGGTAKMFLDGTLLDQTATTDFSTSEMGNLATTLDVGVSNSTLYFNGWIDELRISKGVARWLDDFTIASAAYDTTGGIDGVASANTDVLHTFGKVGSGCLNLDGQYAIALDDTLSFGGGTDGTFSIAGWVRVTDSGSEQVIMSKWDETIGSQAREWKLVLDETRHLKLCLADESVLIDSDLLAHWKMNDSLSTDVVIDETGNHNGTFENGATSYTSENSVSGKIGSALQFKNTLVGPIKTDRVLVADSDELSFGDASDDSAFSLAAWIYMVDATHFVIISKFDTAKSEWRFATDVDGKLVLNLFDTNGSYYIGAKYATALTDFEDSWIHVAATYDGSSTSAGIKLYVNGALVTTVADEDNSYVAMNNFTGDVYIGYSDDAGSGAYLDEKWASGSIDNVMIFGKELSANDVAVIYNSGVGLENLGSVYPYAVTDDALTTGWRFVAATYNGDHASWTGPTALDYATLYVDGVAVDSTASNISDYAAMEDTAAVARIGAQYSTAGAIEHIWQDRIDNIAIFSDVMSAADVLSLYPGEAVYEIRSPYLTADLLSLDIKQSGDVMYIAHDDYEPRKLLRYSDDDWVLEVTGIEDGPFNNENTDTSKTISASATTGNVTLTASGCAPFRTGLTAGHSPSGNDAINKSQTGALFKLVHAIETPSISDTLDITVLDDATTTIEVAQGVEWDYVTQGLWGASANAATVVLERSYDSGTTYETVVTVTSAANANVSTEGVEEVTDAIYRMRVTEVGATNKSCQVQFSLRDTSKTGIVKITSVTSPSVATGTVIKTLGNTTVTHRWSEGSWSNYRGWPRTVEISPEERLTFSGSLNKPLTSWGSVSGDYASFKEGTLDDSAVAFTLIGSGQQNIIQWVVPKDSLMLGTVGGEHLLGGGKDEPLTPSNVTAKLKGTRGSERLSAMLINDNIIFLQRGGRKVRELSNLDTYDASNFRADDLTVFSNHITESGIVDWAYQRVPDPIIWCVRDDGEIAIMMYEKQQEIFSWSRVVLAGTDAKAESVCVIYGGAGEEDQVWITVSRTVDGETVRNIERFKPRLWGSDLEDAFFVDSGITYDSTATTIITGLDHLEGQTVQVFADGVEFDDAVVSSGTIALKLATVTKSASVVHAGLGYTSTIKPMKMDLSGYGLAITKKITEGTIQLYKTIGGQWGNSTSNMLPFDYRSADVFTTGTLVTGDVTIAFYGGYDKSGDVIIRQTGPYPMTVLSITLDVGAH